MTVTAHGIEPFAAERYDGDRECEYKDCADTADWLVELRNRTGPDSNKGSLFCCHSCGRKNRIHPYDVEDNEVSEGVRP